MKLTNLFIPKRVTMYYLSFIFIIKEILRSTANFLCDWVNEKRAQRANITCFSLYQCLLCIIKRNFNKFSFFNQESMTISYFGRRYIEKEKCQTQNYFTIKFTAFVSMQVRRNSLSDDELLVMKQQLRIRLRTGSLRRLRVEKIVRITRIKYRVSLV